MYLTCTYEFYVAYVLLLKKHETDWISVYSRHLAGGNSPRKCKIPPCKREKEGEGKRGGGEGPRELLIPPGCEESRICPGLDDIYYSLLRHEATQTQYNHSQ